MRKPDFCLCENKDADQLYSNSEADQRLCFCFMDSIISPLLQNFKFLTFFWYCKGQFVLDQVRIPEHGFSCIAIELMNKECI